MRISAADFRHRLLPITLAQGVGVACGVAGVRLNSHLVAPADYGRYGVFVALATIGGSVVFTGIMQYVSRHWQAAEDRPALLRAAFSAGLRKLPWLAAAAVLGGLIAAPDRVVLYGTLLFFAALFLTVAQFAQTALQASRQHWRDFGVSSGLSVTRSFSPPLLYAATALGWPAMLAGFTLHALSGVAFGAMGLGRWRTALTPGTALKLPAFYEGPMLVALAVASWILVGMNRWLVAWFFGAEEAGYFVLATNVGAILPTMLGMILLQYAQPQWFAAAHATPAERRRLLGSVDRIAAAFTFLAVGTAMAIHWAMPYLIGPLVSARYAPAEEFVAVTGIGMTAVTLGTFYHSLLLAARRERACGPADLAGAAVLVLGGTLSCAAGFAWFKGWLLASPVVPWLVNRTLARRALLRD